MSGPSGLFQFPPVPLQKYSVGKIIRQFENVNLKPRIRYFFLPEARARCSLFRVALSSILALDTLFDNPRHILQEKSTFGSHSTRPPILFRLNPTLTAFTRALFQLHRFPHHFFYSFLALTQPPHHRTHVRTRTYAKARKRAHAPTCTHGDV